MLTQSNPPTAWNSNERGESTIHCESQRNILVDRLIGCQGKSRQQGSGLVTRSAGMEWRGEQQRMEWRKHAGMQEAEHVTDTQK